MCEQSSIKVYFMDSSFSITCIKLLVQTSYKMYQHTLYILHNLQELTNTRPNNT